MALIRPFVPARDFAVSKAFYQAIGFTLAHDGPDLAILEMEGTGLLLQDYYVQAWAENTMLQLFITGLDGWWERAAGLAERFGVRPPVPPEDKPDWGGIRVGFLFDPSGVLWQVAEPLAR